MKTQKLSLSFIFLLFASTVHAQNLTDVARSKEITWYGIDFTQARFMGFQKEDLKDSLILSWSCADISENNDNMIRKQYGKKIVHVENLLATKRNAKLDLKSLTTSHTYEIGIDKIKNVVAEYKIKGNGYGVLCIVESFEKNNESVFIWVVYTNNSTGEVISSRRYIGKAAGLGMDKHWKTAIEEVIKLSGRDLKLYK